MKQIGKVISIKKARRILGDKYSSLTDEQIAELLYLLDSLALEIIQSKKVPKSS